MQKLEIVDPGLIVIREACNPEDALKFSGQIIDTYKRLGDIGMSNRYDWGQAALRRVSSLIEDDYLGYFSAASKDVFSMFGDTSDTNKKSLVAALNLQYSREQQNFHKDATVHPVVILHGSDGGAFDYSLTATSAEEAQENHSTIDNLVAGDAVVQMSQQYHRGRNTSDEPRVTMAVTSFEGRG